MENYIELILNKTAHMKKLLMVLIAISNLLYAQKNTNTVGGKASFKEKTDSVNTRKFYYKFNNFV